MDQVPARARVSPRASAGRFDPVSIALHWLTLALVLGQLASAWTIDRAGDPALARLALTAHRSMGLATWLVVAARLGWRRSFARLPPFPASMPPLQQWAARANEYGLYGLLLVQPLTGLGDTLLRGRPFALFAWQVPALLAARKDLYGPLHRAHELGALALLALVGVHSAAAAFHALVLRDGVFERMAPWRVR
jgi:cytochrome b561